MIAGILLIVSCFLEYLKIIGIFMLALLKYVNAVNTFIEVSFIAKILLGLGSGMNSTASKILFNLLFSYGNYNIRVQKGQRANDRSL